eukprot:134396-Amorphochlora_amoeboformis.AAC.1
MPNFIVTVAKATAFAGVFAVAWKVYADSYVKNVKNYYKDLKAKAGNTEETIECTVYVATTQI